MTPRYVLVDSVKLCPVRIWTLTYHKVAQSSNYHLYLQSRGWIMYVSFYTTDPLFGVTLNSVAHETMK